jgi:hypothetical protein
MKIFIAEVNSGSDAKLIQPFKKAITSTGGSLTDRMKEADCFVLPWTDATAAAKPMQAMAMDAVRQSQADGKLRLYILPLSESPLPQAYELYLVASSVLPEDAAEAAEIVVNEPQDASCD